MPTGKPKCPVCHGSGTVKEDANEYEFVTRDPISSKCLVCNGTGILNPSTKLPNGKRAFEVWREGKLISKTRGLNVSKKAAVAEQVECSEDGASAIGATASAGTIKLQDDDSTMDVPDIGIDRSVPDDVLDMGKRFEDMRRRDPIPVDSQSRSSALNELIASGAKYLIVAETDPFFLHVYQMKRQWGMVNRTWKTDDEVKYVLFLEKRIEELTITELRIPARQIKEAHNG